MVKISFSFLHLVAGITSYSAIAATAMSTTQMPRIMYGTAWKKERTCDLVVEAVRAGFRGIDTACQPKHYNEPGVGEALSRLAQEHGIARESLFVQTKFTPLPGQDPKNVPYDTKAPLETQVQQSFAKSLENLRTTYIDSLVLHSPLDTHANTMLVWRQFEQFHRQGKVRFLGVSNNYNLKSFEAILRDAEVKPTVLQNRFYRETGYDAELRALCRSHGVTYQSFWTLTGNPNIIASQPLRGLASAIGATPEQAMYRFVMGEGIVPLSGTCSREHMADDVAVEALPLPAAEAAVVRRLLL